MKIRPLSPAVFETERLFVRPLTTGDAEACFAIYGDPEVTRYISPGGQAAPDAGFLLQQIEAGMLAPREDPRFGFWAMERRDDGHVVGTAALVGVDDGDDEYELGWHLARGFWAMGYAFESGIGLLRHGFDRAGLDHILALAHPDNERSLRACRRLGMIPAGRRVTQGYEHECFIAARDSWVPPAPIRVSRP